MFPRVPAVTFSRVTRRAVEFQGGCTYDGRSTTLYATFRIIEGGKRFWLYTMKIGNFYVPRLEYDGYLNVIYGLD